VPIISNVTARPITRADEFLELEVKQVTDAVQWLDSIRLLAYPALAASSPQDEGIYFCLKIGPAESS
jgi:malonyl CoA-acyl carrier protein transacylase